MKILYCVAGEGRGHAVRSKTIIEELSKKHKLVVCGGGKTYDLLSKHFLTEKIGCFNIVYGNNQVKYFRTVIYNLIKFPYILIKNLKLVKIFLKFKPGLIITDFEPFSAYINLLFNKPLITIDNQHIITKSKVKYPKKYFLSSLITNLVVKSAAPRVRYNLITTFFYPKVKSRKVSLVPPILRKEILELGPKKGDWVLVYQTSKSYKKMFDVLKEVDCKFIVYGFDKDRKEGNIVFKKSFNEDEFFEDLAGCKAIIANGGFTLMTEALHLKKPVLSVPVKNQFEQELNAVYLDKLGYGKHCFRLNKELINEFLSSLDKYVDKLEKYKREDNSKVFGKIDEIISKYV